MDAVDASGGIYNHRWGDAPIQTAALEFYAEPSKVARLSTDYLHVSTMNRIFSDGSETDGYFDREMRLHPIVRAHSRLLETVAWNSTNCSSANLTNLTNNLTAGCASESAVSTLRVRHVVILMYTTADKWSFFSEDRLLAIAAEFAGFFSVSTSAVHIKMTFSSAGAGNDAQVGRIEALCVASIKRILFASIHAGGTSVL